MGNQKDVSESIRDIRDRFGIVDKAFTHAYIQICALIMVTPASAALAVASAIDIALTNVVNEIFIAPTASRPAVANWYASYASRIAEDVIDGIAALPLPPEEESLKGSSPDACLAESVIYPFLCWQSICATRLKLFS